MMFSNHLSNLHKIIWTISGEYGIFGKEYSHCGNEEEKP